MVDSQTTALCLCPAFRQEVKQSKAVMEQVERWSLDAQSVLQSAVALGWSQDWVQSPVSIQEGADWLG